MHLKKNSPKGIADQQDADQKSQSNYSELYNIVFFSPEDLNIIKNGPGRREEGLWIWNLSQLDKVYLSNLDKL